MTDYLDVGVVRIQSYLTRAPSLKGRRGASTMVSRASADARAHTPDGTAVNDEAGVVDGVVSLRLDGADDHAAATAVLTRMRQELPASELRAALWRGETYVAARSGRPQWTDDWLPAVAEWPLAKTCDWCRTWPASLQVAEKAQYCADCTRRWTEAGAATDRRPGRAPGPEQELLRRLPGHELPDDLKALAGTLERGRDDTHVVTIHADGNDIGELMARTRDPALARRIHEATWTAVTETVITLPRVGVLPVIPHLVGGDDVLMSLPAHLVWPGVRSLLERFGRALDGVASLSAGVVVHHASEPLSDVVELAAELLTQAKRRHRGTAAVAWHSITHDGPLPVDRPPVSLEQLDRSWESLTALAARPAAARQQLGRLCRESRPGELEAHVDRLGLHAVVGPFRDGSGIALADALAMVRWWEK